MCICLKIRVMLRKLQLAISLVTDRFKAVIWCNSYFEVLCVMHQSFVSPAPLGPGIPGT